MSPSSHTTVATELEVISSLTTYPVIIGAGLLNLAGNIIAKRLDELAIGKKNRRKASCAIITDQIIGRYYGAMVAKALMTAGFSPHIITVAPGENAKDMAVVSSTCEELGKLRVDRDSFLVALGGGVIGDLVGCIAGLYNRGIKYFNLPTTITAQCDSSIGGKTGVNTAAGKNLVGLFYPPTAVISDVSTLLTLPNRIFNEGFAEVVKHAVLKGEVLLDQLEQAAPDLLAADHCVDSRGRIAALAKILASSAAFKITVVKADEFEREGRESSRAILNFGHTIGHALERCIGYGGIYHGESVALGMMAAAWISCRIAGLADNCLARLKRLLTTFSLPTTLREEISDDSLLQSMLTDKKASDGMPRFVLLRRFGEAYLSAPGEVTDGIVKDAISFIRSPAAY